MAKRKINPVKKYANGTNAKGMDPNHYIISPAEAMNDYNIMLAKAEAEANSNPWLPVVGIAGQALQTGINIAGKAAMAKAGSAGGTDEEDEEESIAAMGNNNVQKDVEVEGGEMFETPQGQVGEFKGPSHEQGGIPLEVGEDVEKGTKVYSDRLKIGNKTLAERKATRERQIANLEKIASDNLADEAVKNAAKRKMQAIQKEEAADLQFQDQVNNLQAMADTMVQTFANGTGMKGIQKYEGGTGPEGITYGKGLTEEDFDPYIKSYLLQAPNKKFNLTDFHNYLGVPTKNSGFGKVMGPTTLELAKQKFGENPDAVSLEIPESLKTWGPEAFANTSAKANPMDAVIEAQPEETSNLDVAKALAGDVSATKKEPSKLAKILEGNMPAVGDVTKLIGNYLGMTAGIKTAAEQRSTDITHRNVFANAGEESQRLLDNAKQGIETSKAQAIVKATTVSRGGKKGARGSARGVNTMRGMDWLYDTALQQQIAEISANAANQIAGIDTQKSSVAMSADQLKGQGEYQAAMANEAAKDAYYTALGLGRKDFATGLQQTGKDLNDMKQNKIIENIMKKYGKFVTIDSDGNMVAKNTVKPEEEIFPGPDGKKYKKGKDGKLIEVK